MTSAWIDEHRDDLLRLTSAMIAAPSPNPPGDERAVAAVLVAEFARLGLHGVEIAFKEPHRPNLLLRLKGGQPGPTVMLCGHSDTKPVGDATHWRSDPYAPYVEDGKLYGLGSTDMKGAVAAMVYATAALAQCRDELCGDVLLVINADEERSTEFGSEFLSTTYGLRADVALLGEPSGIRGEEFEFLHLLSRGVSCFKIRVRGTQMHSSLSDRLPSVNASVKLARVLQFMNENLRLTFTPHPLCAKPTVNLGVKLEGGVGYGVYPGLAEFHADVRTLPGMSAAQLQADVEQCLQGLRSQDPDLDVRFEFAPAPLNWLPPTEVSPEHPFVNALLDAAERVLGRRPALSAFPGGTDASKFQAIAGIPTIPSFGPGWLDLAHGPNECVGVEAIVQAAKIYALAVQSHLHP